MRPKTAALASPPRRPTTSGRGPTAPTNRSRTSGARSASPPPRRAQHYAPSPAGASGAGLGLGMAGWSPDQDTSLTATSLGFMDAPLTAAALGIGGASPIEGARNNASPPPPTPPARTKPFSSLSSSPPQHQAEVVSDHQQRGRGGGHWGLGGDPYSSNASVDHPSRHPPATSFSLSLTTASSSSSSGVLAQAKDRKLGEIYALLTRGGQLVNSVPGDVSSIASLIGDEELASLIVSFCAIGRELADELQGLDLSMRFISRLLSCAVLGVVGCGQCFMIRSAATHIVAKLFFHHCYSRVMDFAPDVHQPHTCTASPNSCLRPMFLFASKLLFASFVSVCVQTLVCVLSAHQPDTCGPRRSP